MPHLDNLKKQVKQIVRWHRETYYPVAQRIRDALPRFRELDDATILSKPFALNDAHELLARELGFDSWQLLRAADLSALRPAAHQSRLLCARSPGTRLSQFCGTCTCPS